MRRGLDYSHDTVLRPIPPRPNLPSYGRRSHPAPTSVGRCLLTLVAKVLDSVCLMFTDPQHISFASLLPERHQLRTAVPFAHKETGPLLSLMDHIGGKDFYLRSRTEGQTSAIHTSTLAVDLNLDAFAHGVYPMDFLRNVPLRRLQRTTAQCSSR
ncbi:hypothetical protein EV421DRAFT_549310 [Armillaria borealis]|uniref:Uncharacterized protein n=1 Tax=Armillaria borealis TaxID=47425 RepID=A0AA39JHG0_9AGAR|nr:hypothetical protein EV421DRAFT_549310 [Armillaria borealis]